MTTDNEYFERGINLRHGYLTEYYVEDEEFVVKIPEGLKDVGVLLEPMTVAQKGITQAYEIQRRLKVWRPKTAAVMGAGTLGLLASLVLRLRGLSVTTFGRTSRPYLNADLLDAIGARYMNTAEQSITATAGMNGAYDLIFEGTGSSSVVFESMQVLAKNGVLVLTSITGGNHSLQVPADRINLDFVLGNKVMFGTVNAGREHFEEGVRDMAIAEATRPGWLARLLTHPVDGLDQYEQALSLLTTPGVIKAYVQIGR
jgi:threonine dehydrogenase-like Zn-dependent dehydrogenase